MSTYKNRAWKIYVRGVHHSSADQPATLPDTWVPYKYTLLSWVIVSHLGREGQHTSQSDKSNGRDMIGQLPSGSCPVPPCSALLLPDCVLCRALPPLLCLLPSCLDMSPVTGESFSWTRYSSVMAAHCEAVDR